MQDNLGTMSVDAMDLKFLNIGKVQGAAVRKPLNTSSQYGAEAERKEDLLDK